MMIDYTAILNIKYPDAKWALNGDDYDGLIWLSDDDKPTKKELDELWPEVQNQILIERQAKADAKAALLERLGITEEEAKLLLK
jgi:hypothetical protein